MFPVPAPAILYPIRKLLPAILLFLICFVGQAGNPETFQLNQWELSFDGETGRTTLIQDGRTLVRESQARFRLGEQLVRLEELTGHEAEAFSIEDAFGTGRGLRITARTEDGGLTFTQTYRAYDQHPFLLTGFSLESAQELSSNHMAPVYSTRPQAILPPGSNTVLWVPYDNDKWVRYRTLDFGTTVTSYEVGAFFDPASRNGLVAGSVTHDTWKTGVLSTTGGNNSINSLEVFGGVTSYETRDVLPHGAVRGTRIESPLIFLGYYEDWRRGMEDYADANRISAPRLPWDQGKPFGWNSWGAIQTDLSYQNATEVAEYIAENLMPQGFLNDSTVYIGLDSYWDNITYSNLVRFARETKSRGQQPGIYWSPFVDWGRNPDRTVEGSTNVFYRDIYLYANGQPQEIATAYAIDPTHPASKRRMDLYLERFINQGFTYLKLDFLSHGALESDGYYNPDVTTGKQAYNEGMQYILDYLGDRMFINLSIAPLFPGGRYAHSRRIACDAYAGINDTEYTLNSLSYGWWLDRVYTYNDADNVVLTGVSLGENRARYTSSVITGIICVGDNFSSTGYPTAKQRAEEFFTNEEVNRVARNAKAFYPVEPARGGAAADMFVQTVEDTLYLAVYNYTTSHQSREIDLERIGLERGMTYTAHELWSDESEIVSGSLETTVPRRDVKFFKITRDFSSGTAGPQTSDYRLFPNPARDFVRLSGDLEEAREILLINPAGQVVRRFDPALNRLTVGGLKPGVYILSVTTRDGSRHSLRFIKH
jgi:alpha-galactosidase